jgi:hypothetical protein
MKILISIWNYLNGNKTIICTFIWILISKDIIHVTPEWQSVIEWILGTLTGGSFVHHIKKGYLQKSKGD